MKTEEIKMNSDSFEFNGKTYDCTLIVIKDKDLIIKEAEESHKEALYTLYERDSLHPDYVRLFLDDNDNPLYLMVIYLIKYRDNKHGRYACGNYYPINKESHYVIPHPYQGSICW